MADSLRNLLIRLTLVTRNSNGTERLDIPTDSYFRDAHFEMSAEGVGKGVITLFDADNLDSPEHPFLEILLLSVGFAYSIEMQWKIDDGTPLVAAPVYACNILKVTPSFSMLGTTYTLELAVGNILSDLTSTPKASIGFRAGTRITDIVAEIADLQEWPHRTVIGGPFETIEPAKAVLKAEANLINESHNQFIRQTLMPQLLSDSQRPYYLYFDRNGVFHFHSDTWLKAATKAYNYPDVDGEVKDFSVENSGVLAQFQGGNNATFIAPDSAAGEFARVNCTLTGGVVFGISESVVNGYGGAQYSVEVTDQSQRKGVIVRDRETLFQRAMASYVAYQSFTFAMTLNAIGTHDVFPGTFVNVTRRRPNGSIHPVSGDYFVQATVQTVTRTLWETSISGVRSGMLQPSKLAQATKTLSGGSIRIPFVSLSGSKIEKTAMEVAS